MQRIKIGDFSSIKNSTIFLDVDGTLVPDATQDLSEESGVLISTLKVSNKIILASNSRMKERTALLGQKLGLEVLDGIKPSDESCVNALLNNPPYVVIGDKWWTDGIFAKKIGAKFFMVRPIWAKTDSPIMKIQYIINSLTFWLLPIASLFIMKQNKMT